VIPRPRRFERKILGAMVLVALGPLVGALLLGRQALRETYEVGVNDRVGGQLTGQLELYRAHFEALRTSAEQLADLAAADVALAQAVAPVEPDLDDAAARLREFLDAHPTVAQATVVRGDQAILAVPTDPRHDAGSHRLLTLRRPLIRRPGTMGPEAEVEVTVGAPRRLFAAFEEAGAIHEVYERLSQERDYLSGTYLLVFSSLLGAIIVVALGVGLVLGRRVTRRVGLLVEATARVGRGDLRTTLPVDGRDEVGELTRSFNRMVRDLRESRDRIDYLQRVSAWQEFARRLAHEIKNPLTPIQLAVQEIDRAYRVGDPKYADKLADAKTIVEEEIATLRRLVGEFSGFAKLPAVRLERADLGETVDEVSRGLRTIPEEEELRRRDRDAHGDGDPPASAPAVRVEVVPDGGRGIDVLVDPMLFRRVLDNLVRNAVQALLRTPAGGVVRVVAGPAVDGGGELLVADDGPGIPPDLLDRVFDPYVTTRVDGTGLGLAIVKKIVLEHDGEIELLPAEPRGTIARIRLPAAPPRGHG